MKLFAILLAAGLSACSQPAEDILVFGRGSDAVGLDPALENDGESFKVCDNLYENLVTYESGSTAVVPQLARSWEVSQDRLVWTFRLRTGVRFHDGTPFNAGAMLFSLQRQYDPEHPAHKVQGAYKYWKDMGMDEVVEGMEAPDDSTLVIRLRQANAPFLSTLAMNFCAAVSPAAVRKFGDDYFKNPVGTGPFRFVEWRKDERIVLERFDGYWGEKAGVKRLLFKPIQEASVRLLELQSGAIHGLDNLVPEYIPRVKKDPNLQLLTQPGMNVGYLAMNMDKPPFDNRLVRQALNHAINKQTLVDNFYQGLALPAKNPIPPTLWGYNDDIEAYPYDPQKARQLLAEAGFADGFDTELWAMPVPRPYMPQPDKIAQAIQADLKAVGVRAQIRQWEWGTYLDKVSKGEHTMALLGWTGDNGDPDNFLSVLLSCKGANLARWCDKEFDDLVMSAKRTADVAERTALYQEAQQVFKREAPWVTIAHSMVYEPVRREVQGYRIDPFGGHIFYGVDLRSELDQ